MLLLNSPVNNSLVANSNHFYFDYKDGKYGYNTDPNRGADTFVPFSSGVYGTFTPTNATETYNIDLGFRPKALMIMNAYGSWCTAYYLNEETNEIHHQSGGYGDKYSFLNNVVTITDNGFAFCLSEHEQSGNQINKIHYYIAI